MNRTKEMSMDTSEIDGQTTYKILKNDNFFLRKKEMQVCSTKKKIKKNNDDNNKNNKNNFPRHFIMVV